MTQFQHEPTGPLPLRPLVRVGAQIIVAAPHSLLAACTRAVVARAQQLGVTDALDACVADAVHAQVLLALTRLGTVPVQIDLPPLTHPDTAHQGMFQYDLDRYLLVLEVVEPASGVDPSRLISDSAAQIRDARGPLLTAGYPDVLFMVVFAGYGDRFQLHCPGTDAASILMFSPDQLDVVSWKYRSMPLTLHHYARSRLALYQQHQVSRWSSIDEFAFLAERQFSSHFALPPGSPVSILPGYGSDFVRETLVQADSHHAPWISSRWTLVERSPLRPSGLYAPLYSPWSRPVLLIETGGVHLWVLEKEGQESDEAPEAQREDSRTDLVQACALWLSDVMQARPEFQPPVPVLPFWIVFDLSLDCPVQVMADPATSTIGAVFGPAFDAALQIPDNTAERDLVRELCAAWLHLCRGKVGPQEEINALARQVAPAGDKRYLMNPASQSDRALAPRGVQTPILFHHGTVNTFRALAGQALRREHTLASGPQLLGTPDLLNGAVSVLYQGLKRQIATFDPRVLLDALVEQHEALRFSAALRDHTSLHVMAAFGGHSAQDAEVLERLPGSSTAVRFLIEYVVAQSPQGSRQPGLLDLEELTSLGMAILLYGTASDALKYQVGTVEAFLTDEDIFHVRTASFMQAADDLHSYMLHRMAEQALAERYAEHQGQDVAAEISVDNTESIAHLTNGACQEVYGLTLVQVLDFMESVERIGLEAEGRRTRMAEEALHDRLCEMGWSGKDIEKAFDALVLDARAEYLRPPKPWKATEVYPWQYNRELSVIRRPLFRQQTSEGGRDIVWGNRTLYTSQQHWLHERFLGGRFAPEASPDAHRHMASLRALYAQTYNDHVAALATSLGLRATTNVRKIGSLKLEQGGQTLGDIDVLIFDKVRRRVLAVECKDWVLSRTPLEIHGRFVELFEGALRSDGSRERSIMEKHRRRGQWMQEHLGQVLQTFQLSTAQEWTVEALIVTSRPLSRMLAARGPLRVLNTEEFSRDLLI